MFGRQPRAMRTRPPACPDHPGGTVARAKRTERAEARRRYRSATTSQPDAVLDAAVPAPSGTKDGPTRTADAKAAAPPARPGIARAFRESFPPVDIRGDLRALPRLLMHWSFYVPVLLS